MQCIQCSESNLVPTKLEPTLAGRGCSSCGGTLLNLVAYRLWRERHLGESTEDASLEAVPEESGKALLCGKCNRIMLRYRYTADTKHVLDVCIHCEDVWLQDNEWPFLKSRSLHGDLPRIFTEPWQSKRRKAQQQAALHEEWDRRLGAELHTEAAELREWLNSQKDRAAVLSYLTSSDPYRA